MGLFRPYDQKNKAPAPATPAAAETKAGGAPKNRPTPTRQQAQAARKETLHPKLTKREAAAQDRAASEQRRRKDMLAVDNQPERVLMRNYIDARRSPTEFLWPVLMILLAASFFAKTPTLSFVVMGLMWAMLLVAIVTVWWYWQGYKRELGSRYPSASTKGLVMMFASRMMSFRRIRNPAPTLKPGDTY